MGTVRQMSKYADEKMCKCRIVTGGLADLIKFQAGLLNLGFVSGL